MSKTPTKHRKTNAASFTIGIDLGDRKHAICVLDDQGDIVREDSISNTREALSKLADQYPAATAIIETGTHSPWISWHLEACGLKVLVANARKLRAIYQNDRKCDRYDAMMLARIGRMDPKLLSPIRHRSESCQRDQALLKTRCALVRTRVNAINSVRFILKSLGVQLPAGWSSTSFGKKARAFLSQEDRRLINPLIELAIVCTEELKLLDEELDQLAREPYPETQRFQQIPGVGPITALAFVLTLESKARFARARDVGPFLGLTPKRDQSGQSDKHQRISKAGTPYLRTLLVSCAQYIIGPFGPPGQLREAGLRIAGNTGHRIDKKRAVIATARKLAVTMLALWKNDADYQPTLQSA